METNRDQGYERISKAPPPTERFRQFLALDYPRKVVTIEPVMDLDLDTFAGWVFDFGDHNVFRYTCEKVFPNVMGSPQATVLETKGPRPE